MKILVGIPSRHTIDVESAVSIMNLDRAGHAVDFCHSDGAGVYGVAQARNALCLKAVEGDYDKLLMIDSDVIVPRDAIKNLLDPDVPLVVGVARFKSDSGATTVYGPGVGPQRVLLWDDIPEKRFDIVEAGMSCVMIDVEVLRKMPRPWFVWTEHENGSYCGEDLKFMENAYRMNVYAQADGRVKCGHIGRKIYD